MQADQAGPYQVVLTNLSGSVTSTVAHLKVLVAPLIDLASLSATPTNFALSFGSVMGLTYSLEYKNSLSDPSWTPLPPPLPGTGGPLTLQDTNAALLPSRFYRVNSQ